MPNSTLIFLHNHWKFGAHVDNLLVVSPGNCHSGSQTNVNNPTGDSYEVPREKSAFTAEDR